MITLTFVILGIVTFGIAFLFYLDCTVSKYGLFRYEKRQNCIYSIMGIGICLFIIGWGLAVICSLKYIIKLGILF